MTLRHTPEKLDGFTAPDFALTNIDGQTYDLKDCMGAHGLVVMFICNHCPYVIAIIERLAQTCNRLHDEGIGCVAIMANDTESYPADSFENIKLFSEKYAFKPPYLIDKTQNTAKAYDAVCTPDFFGFDKGGLLQYRGRLDSAANKPADEHTVPELLNAMLEFKNKGQVSAPQTPSMGCSIKWRT
ncbi:MAG: thioredoxin family protein [Alphaproteobacteria bacterium]|nr:MAG: thioredoxin family protein [Alphaproteobacteria bacterium]